MTPAIESAYSNLRAVLCSAWHSGEISEQAFGEAIKRLNEIEAILA